MHSRHVIFRFFPSSSVFLISSDLTARHSSSSRFDFVDAWRLPVWSSSPLQQWLPIPLSPPLLLGAEGSSAPDPLVATPPPRAASPPPRSLPFLPSAASHRGRLPPRSNVGCVDVDDDAWLCHLAHMPLLPLPSTFFRRQSLYWLAAWLRLARHPTQWYRVNKFGAFCRNSSKFDGFGPARIQKSPNLLFIVSKF
jgi:hypothetical protein